MNVVRDNVWAAVGLFLGPVEACTPVLRRCMGALMSGVSKLVEKMGEWS